MSGDSWCETLPRTMCTLSRSAEQPSDSTLPPVLAFRCTTDDAYEDEMEDFEVSTFMTEETWVEVFEYRCSKPWVMRVAVDVTLYGYDPDHSSFFFRCTDDRGQTVQTVHLQVADDGVRSALCFIFVSFFVWGGSVVPGDFTSVNFFSPSIRIRPC